MRKSKFSEERIAFILRQAEEGTTVKEVCCKAGISVQTYYRWRSKYGGLMLSEMNGTGGVRKLRWGLEGRGKRGGARVLYFYHSEAMPLFALSAYAKNERADLSQADLNDFRRLTAMLVDAYARRSKR